MLSLSWLRSFRLFVDGNDLVDSNNSASVKYVYVHYIRNYENDLYRSKEECTIWMLLSSKQVGCVWSCSIAVMPCGASASGSARVWVQRIITVRDGETSQVTFPTHHQIEIAPYSVSSSRLGSVLHNIML